jgi:pimeloyl-ACP methyl ester carboxylesterase
MKKLVVLLVAGALLTCGARAASPPSDSLLSVGSHRLQIHREGKGRPAVVIDAGLGDQLDKLKPLQERLARVTQVITYNRAGYGQSEPGPLPRDGAHEAEELRTLLHRAHVPGPYVLVGHSLGAMNVLIFASKYPRDVAGLILLDPPPLGFALGKAYPDLWGMAERMTAEWQAIADSTAKSVDPRDRTQSAFFRMIASEHREMRASARLVDGITTFGDLPLVVMASGKPNPAFGPIADEFQRYWIEQSRALAARSTKGAFVLAEQSSHFLYLDVPELVEKSVLSVVNAASH